VLSEAFRSLYTSSRGHKFYAAGRKVKVSLERNSPRKGHCQTVTATRYDLV
jgi:hypothetical protein